MTVKKEKLEKNFIYSYREGKKGSKVDGYFFLPPFPKLSPTSQALNIRTKEDTVFYLTFKDGGEPISYHLLNNGGCLANMTNRQIDKIYTW